MKGVNIYTFNPKSLSSLYFHAMNEFSLRQFRKSLKKLFYYGKSQAYTKGENCK